MTYADMPYVVFAIGRVGPAGVSLLGTATLVNRPGTLVTAAHVTGNTDQNLVLIHKPRKTIDDYQDTSDTSINLYPLRINAIDPLTDLCVLQIIDEKVDVKSTVRISNIDALKVGHGVDLFGFPHADSGRHVLTHQRAHVGAKILISTSGVKTKNIVLNMQARPGQSGGPIFSAQDQSLVAILIGSYAPAGGSTISLGGIDPQTLHQTTHAISAEYIVEMLSE